MIYSASEMRRRLNQNASYIAELDAQAAGVMQSIERAASSGASTTCFSVHPRYADDVKKLFIKTGYTFKPTGYVGGVWQLSEDICW